FSDSFRFLILSYPSPRALRAPSEPAPASAPILLILRGFGPRIELHVPAHSQAVPGLPGPAAALLNSACNPSVATREHLPQRALPLLPALTTLKYSGY